MRVVQVDRMHSPGLSLSPVVATTGAKLSSLASRDARYRCPAPLLLSSSQRRRDASESTLRGPLLLLPTGRGSASHHALLDMASRTVAHSSALDLLRAIEGQPDADSVRTNHCLGFVFARWLEPFSPPAPSPDKAPGDNDKPDQDAEVLVTVWQGDRLVCALVPPSRAAGLKLEARTDLFVNSLIFTKLGWSQSKIVSPVASSDLAAVLPSIPPLVQHLLTVAPFSSAPGLLRSLCGPQTLVDAFLASWPHPRKPSPSMTIIPMSTRSAPSTVVLPDGHSFSRIRDVAQLSLAELNKIGQLLVTFYGNHPSAPRFSPDGLVEHTRAMILRGAFWVYRAPPCEGHEAEPVGFVQTGRPTMRTCAIRMVFVAPSHRGAGVAQRMVSAVVRAHLVEAPRLALDFARTPLEGETEEETTRFGGKDEVCLFVEPGNAAARRVYAQVGMEEGGDLWSCVELGEVEPGHW